MRVYTKEQVDEAKEIIRNGGPVDFDLALIVIEREIQEREWRKAQRKFLWKKLTIMTVVLGLWLGFLLISLKWGGLWEAICGK